ncbi:lysophospholipid acyltransferase family protein [Riemerella columbipharyngis]|uniref:Lipid A biosynthesis acyltransferase n=1 Tax=Riemerella columbipharyngis TaxID=1071918 RepID=A0A1G7FRF6_9FLAO|nr:hypothetical protein [Riemerella columbipharyngis]SDE78349.1 hypothetical protein SAMN05421544_1269 [Riemerella columbipharyngis]
MKADYFNRIDEIYSQVEKKIKEIDYYDKVLESSQYNLMSGSLFKMLPKLKYEKHYDVFNGIQLHNTLTKFEQTSEDVLDYITIENLSRETLELLKNNPCVISTFHFGSYRVLNKYLVENNISYTAIAPRSIIESDKECFEKNMFIKGDAKFIEFEAPNVAFQILRELRSGRSVFVYLDGFRGNLNNISSECAIINFLEQKLYVKKGIIQLASIANVPLITGLSYRKSKNDVRLHFFDPIQDDKSKDREDFVQDTLENVYNQFSYFVNQYPEQWEAWMYLYKQMVIETNTQEYEKKEVIDFNNSQLYFNSKRFGIFKILDENFLFDRYKFISYSIDENLYKSLQRALKYDLHKVSNIDNSMIEELYYNNILVA